jgi:hypothetical protein
VGREQIEDLGVEQEYDLELIGNFGRFVSGQSYPIEYLMTTMTMSEVIKYLRFAREIQMDQIDFDLLMQRDIDEGRVEVEIMPYLQPDQLIEATKPLFFPPLLAAVVPVVENRIQNFYGALQVLDTDSQYAGKQWKSHFKLEAKRSAGSEGLPVVLDNEDLRIKSKQAILSLRTTEMHADGVTLIVIDGQHRLMALKRLWSEHREKVRNMVVPVCIMYPPNSYGREAGDKLTPAVPRVFRELFVAVNSTMRQVGGHFNILLSDRTIGDIACRQFCESVLSKYGKEGLAFVEWNTRNKKEAFNLTKKYTGTTIGIIFKGLEENFKADSIVYHLLNIVAGAEDLFPEGADLEDYFPKIKWDKFSYAQSSAIQIRAKKFISPLLMRLYFESAPFMELRKIFEDELATLTSEVKSGGKFGLAAQAVIQRLVEYKPFDEKNLSFNSRWVDFEVSVNSKLESSDFRILTYALFQRSLFQVAAIFIRIGMGCNVSVEASFDGFLELINRVFNRDPKFFDPRRQYMQFTAFTAQMRIRTREQTKHAFRDLIISNLLIDEIRSAVIDVSFRSAHSARDIDDYMSKIAFEAAGATIRRYREERTREFKKAYEVDYSLGQEIREDLKLKEIAQRTNEQAIRDGRIDQASVVMEFDILVNSFIEEYVLEMKQSLRESLGIYSDFMEIDSGEDSIESEDA